MDIRTIDSDKGKVTTIISDIALVIMGTLGVTQSNQSIVLQFIGIGLIIILAILDIRYPEYAKELRQAFNEDETA